MGVSLKSDTGKIELAIHSLIETPLAGVCDFVKAGPRNATQNPEKSVYCDSPVPVVDLAAINRTTSRIEIYVKKINGFKDITTLTQIRDVVVNLIGQGVTIDKTYFVALESEISQDDGGDFNFIFLNLAVTII